MLFKKTFLLLSVLLILAQGQTLPGVDYIKSGYDGLKLLNDQLGQSKYPVFNLDSQNGETDFLLNDQNYKVPTTIQATPQSLRKETQCEGIYQSFSDFQKKYSESISFSVGLTYAGYSAALGFNHQLDEIHQKMTQSNKAVSVSQSYWAMYSLTTAPAFLMPLNPMFKQSLDALNRMAKDPQNDTQQTIYNQVISSFGTHYVTSVVMGGSAKIFTTIDSEYLKSFNYEQVKNQVSLDFSYMVFKFKFGFDTTDATQIPSEDFKKNSENMIVFSPEVDHIQDPKAWATWESQVPQKPQPVNTTVSYISDLAYEYPEIQGHLKKTIEFYLKNGKLPSFGEIQNFQVALQSTKTTSLFSKRILYKLLSESNIDEAVKELCPFPGYHGTYCPQQIPSFLAQKKQFEQSIPKMPSGIGASFDISTGQLKLPAIQLTYSSKPSQEQIYKDPISDHSFIVADETQIEQINLDADVKIFKNEFELTKIWLDATKNGQWLGGEYSQSKDLNDVFEKYFKGNQETSISQLSKNVIRLTFKTDNLKLNRFAQRAIDALPEEFQPDIYNGFLNSWGTHISIDTYIGGMIEKQTVFKDCVYATPSFTGGLSADQVVQALHNELKGNPADGYFAARRQVSIDHKFGGNPEDVANWEIINNRVEAMKQRQESYQAQIREERRVKNCAPRPAYAVSGCGKASSLNIKQKFEIRNQFMLQEASQCPVGLPFDISKNRCSSGNMDKVEGMLKEVRYERDDKGNFRTVLLNPLSRINKGEPEYYGNWVDRGCSLAQGNRDPQYNDFNQIPPDYSKFKMICTDCIPTLYNAKGAQLLQCLCPAF
ncbi:hypothetical protein ABPG72_016157 [Tetrahymena utriculariae]